MEYGLRIRLDAASSVAMIMADKKTALFEIHPEHSSREDVLL